MMRSLLGIAAVLLLVSPARAVINPELTPVHLVRQSTQVWQLEVSPAEQAGRVNARSIKALKGQPPERALVIEGTSVKETQAAVLFVADAGGVKIGSLYASGKWYRLTSRTAVLWQAEAADRSLGGTWNGAVEMLARAVEYVEADPSATVPATCDAAFGQPQQIAKLADVRGLHVVDRGRGPTLLVEAGDRWLEYLPDKGTLIESRPPERTLDLATLIGFEPQRRPLSAVPGDFEADGKLDVLVAGPDGLQIWSNTGERMFRETLAESGELAALAPAKPAGAIVCDINNDGRQDVLVWSAGGPPQFFFNRGFRCFGAATNLGLDKHPLLKSVQFATVADFNGDGCQDLAAGTADGAVVVLPRDPAKGNKLAVSVSLPPLLSGPITVSAADGKRPLGAQVVQAGQAAFFGKTGKGPLTLQWQTPGGPLKSKQVIVLKPTPVVLDAP